MYGWLTDLLVGPFLPRVARIGLSLAVGVFLANLLVAFGLVERVGSNTALKVVFIRVAVTMALA